VLALQAELGWSAEEADRNLNQMCASELQSELTPVGGIPNRGVLTALINATGRRYGVEPSDL
jgi:hypothetical protein